MEDATNGYIYEIASPLEMGVADHREQALIVWRHHRDAEAAQVVRVLPSRGADRAALAGRPAGHHRSGGVRSMTIYAEKLLPHDVEAEEAVLGSLLIDGQCIARLAPLLKGGDFYRERNQTLLRRRRGPLPAGPGHRPAHPGRGAGPHREAGPGRRHGLPLPPGLHHPHLSPRRGLRPGRLPHRHHAQTDRRRRAHHRPGIQRHRRPGRHHPRGRGRPLRCAGQRAQKGLHPPPAVLRPVPPGAGRKPPTRGWLRECR